MASPKLPTGNPTLSKNREASGVSPIALVREQRYAYLAAIAMR
jgi:hypothetical protein